MTTPIKIIIALLLLEISLHIVEVVVDLEQSGIIDENL